MANWEVTKTKRWNKPIEEHHANLKSGSYRIEVPEGSRMGVLYRWDDLRGYERIASGEIASLKSQAERMTAKQSRGVAAIERLANMSRPGSKDVMAVEDRFYFGKGRKERFASKEQAAAFIQQYKRNEESNYHSENVVLLAKFMGNAKVAKLASLVQQINEVAGHLPQGVAQFQYRELHEPLWKQFIAQYGDLYRSMK